MHAYIMCGPPGSGKTTLVRAYAKMFRRHTPIVCSADDYYTDAHGQYHYSIDLHPEAHNYCFRKFVDAVSNRKSEVVIADNTHSRISESAPYMMAAKAFGYHAIFTIVTAPLEILIARAHERGEKKKIPLDVVEAMYLRTNPDLDSWDAPPKWWNVSIFDQARLVEMCGQVGIAR